MRFRADGRTLPPRGWWAIRRALRRMTSSTALLGAFVLVFALGLIAAYYFGYYVAPRHTLPDILTATPTPTTTATPTATPPRATEFERETLVNQARTAAVQALGGIVLALGAVLTVRTLRLTRQGQITDRFTAAVGQLGAEQTSVRVAAIHALGRVMRDSRADHAAVMAILTDHLREYCPRARESEGPKGARGKPAVGPHPEVQAVSLVLRNRPRRRLDEGVLDLSGIDWRAAPLAGARLVDAEFFDTTLVGAYLAGADLRGANLNGADLTDAGLERADLREADVKGTVLYGARAIRADFRECDLATTRFNEHTRLFGARFDPGGRPAKGNFSEPGR